MSDWHDLFNAASYVFGQCTQYVAGVTSWVGGHWGNACQWVDNARKDGFTISSKPAKGAIAVYDCSLAGSGGDGHVAKVESVSASDPNTFTLSEANWNAFNTVDIRQESLDSPTGQKIIGFIMPPGLTDNSSSNAQTTSSNPLDPSGFTGTVSKIGDQIGKDLTRVALSLLGFFVFMVGIGLLLSADLRQTLEGDVSRVPGPHGLAGNSALKEADKIEA